MASKKSTRLTLKGSGKGQGVSYLAQSVLEAGLVGVPTDNQGFEGSVWRLSMVPSDLEALRWAFDILERTVLDIPRLDEGVVDPEGIAYKMALFPSIFLYDLQLPFCLLVCDVMDMVGVAPAQLLPNSWRILVGCCMIWR